VYNFGEGLMFMLSFLLFIGLLFGIGFGLILSHIDMDIFWFGVKFAWV